MSGSECFPDVEVPEGSGQELTYVFEYTGETVHLSNKGLQINCFGIICGDFCGKCLRVCPPKKLAIRDMKDSNLSGRNILVTRYLLS